MTYPANNDGTPIPASRIRKVDESSTTRVSYALLEQPSRTMRRYNDDATSEDWVTPVALEIGRRSSRHGSETFYNVTCEVPRHWARFSSSHQRAEKIYRYGVDSEYGVDGPTPDWVLDLAKLVERYSSDPPLPGSAWGARVEHLIEEYEGMDEASRSDSLLRLFMFSASSLLDRVDSDAFAIAKQIQAYPFGATGTADFQAFVRKATTVLNWESVDS